jgi:peroxiredoxin
MKKLVPLILIIAGLALAVYLYTLYRIPPKIDAPNITFITDNGQQNLSTFKGQNTIVVFYASWCGTCLSEMKPLALAGESLRSDNFRIVGLTDDTPELIEKVRERFEVPFELYPLTGKLKNHGVYTLPTTYVLNEEGQIVFQKVDAIDWSDQEFLDELRNLVK